MKTLLAGLGADPARDAQFRNAALRIADEIRDTIYGIAKSKRAMDAIAMDGKMMTRFAINLESLGIRSTEFLLLIERPSSTRPEAAYFTAENMIISLKMLPMDAPEAVSTRQGRKMLEKFLIDRFHRHRDIIVHEVIHMIDYLRGNPMFLKEQRYLNAPKEQFRILYINNPLEFNAMFQQAVVQIQDVIARMPRGRQAEIASDFQKFMVVAEGTSTIKQMRASILPEWERKLDARLWQTWDHARNQ